MHAGIFCHQKPSKEQKYFIVKYSKSGFFKTRKVEDQFWVKFWTLHQRQLVAKCTLANRYTRG